MAALTVSSEIERLTESLRSSRRAINEMGGTVASDAGFSSLPEAISTLPVSQDLIELTDDTVAYSKDVPQKSAKAAAVKKLGGMSYKSKNLIQQSALQNYNANGITCKYLEDEDSIFVDGTVSAKEAIMIANYTYKAPIKPNTNYVRTSFAISGSTTIPNDGWCVFYLGYDDNGKRANWMSVSLNTNEIHSVVKNSNAVTSMFGFWIFATPGVVFDNYKFRVSLQEGDEKLTDYSQYTPYFEGIHDAGVSQIISTDKDGNTESATVIPEEILSLDGYGRGVYGEDCNYIDFERRVFIRKTRRIVFDGSEWGDNLSGGTFTYALPTPYKMNSGHRGAVCSHFEMTETPLSPVAPSAGLVYGEYIRFYTSYQSSTEWKAWLSKIYSEGNPLTLEYAMNTAEEIPLDRLPDNIIGVNGGGKITFENTDKKAVPSTVAFEVFAN